MAQQRSDSQKNDVYDEVFVEIFDGGSSDTTTEKWSVWTGRGGQIVMGDSENDNGLAVRLTALEAAALARLLMKQARDQAAVLSRMVKEGGA